MITASFDISEGWIIGFTVTGHADYSEAGSDIICAAVSSAVYMTANTITEILGINAKIDEEEGFLKLSLTQNDAENSCVLLDGLRLHLSALAENYKDYISIQISEV